MSVNMDAADAGTRTLASGPGAGRWAEPGFQLDSVSYITHDTSLSSAGDTQVSRGPQFGHLVYMMYLYIFANQTKPA